jgi:hypothetical protein
VCSIKALKETQAQQNRDPDQVILLSVLPNPGSRALARKAGTRALNAESPRRVTGVFHKPPQGGFCKLLSHRRRKSAFGGSRS